MKIVQQAWLEDHGATTLAPVEPDAKVQLVLAFGSRAALDRSDLHARLRGQYPNAEILLGSSAGEILGTTVYENSVCVTAIEFEKSQVRAVSVQLTDDFDRFSAGKHLAQSLKGDTLAMVFVISDGQNVNGSQLVDGFNAIFKGSVPVAGGLAGDGADFIATRVGLNAPPQSGNVAAVGIYGNDLVAGFGSQGGWEPFGPERNVTASEGNVLLALNGSSALELYQRYLGELAEGLPASGLRFPLSILLPGTDQVAVRTLLAIDEKQQSMTFAGDMPVGSKVRLMKASSDKLIDGATDAALESKSQLGTSAELAILVSCVGRKLVLNQRVEEEVESVAKWFPTAAICGFYSYGEISPSHHDGHCQLHNQTMTITTISER